MKQPAVRSVCAAWVIAGLVATLAGAQSTQSSGAMALPSDSDIRKMLAERVEALSSQEGGIGIVVGVIEPRGQRVVSYGHLGKGDPRPLDGDAGFEIGSVTKVFTALLLADMVQRGEVALADPVTKHLPAGINVPERNGRPITLLDLATHTSGLPFMPEELPASADSTAAKPSTAGLYQFLAGYRLPRDVGAEWEYSNFGYWLLSEALATRAGTDYESLLRTRVIAPLGLKDTAIDLPPGLKAKLAVGHNAVLQPVPSGLGDSSYALMPAAGGLVSTTHDLLRVLSVAMGYERSPLAPAMAALLGARRPAHGSGVVQALGWVMLEEGDDQLVFHDGGTWGFASSVAWDPTRRVGVVVLSNQVTGVSDLARHLLRPNVPLKKPTATKRTEIALEPALLDTYAGHYDARDEGVVVILREGDFLTIELPASWGLPKLRLRPESRRDFFVAELPLRVTFQTDSEGRVSGLLIYPPRGQQAVPADRINKAG